MKSPLKPTNSQKHRHTPSFPCPLQPIQRKQKKYKKKITITHSYNRIIATKQRKNSNAAEQNANRATPRALAAWGIPRLIQTREKKT